jgi:AraC family transcriptional regulator
MTKPISDLQSRNPRQAAPTSNKELSSFSVTVEELAAKRVLAVAHRGPYSAIGEAFEALDRIVRSSTLLSLPGLEMVAIHHDDPDATPSAELRASAGLVVPVDAVGPDGLHEVILPAGLYAHVTHVGPYETLGDTWSQLRGEWLGSSTYRIAGAHCYERYLNTPENAAPHELKTVLYVPIVGAS